MSGFQSPTAFIASPREYNYEIDVEILQDRTRQWLQEILGEEFLSDRTLSEILEDGEVLARLTSLILESLTRHSVGEFSHSSTPSSHDAKQNSTPKKNKYGIPSPYRSSSGGAKHGHWMAIQHVDNFLKLCKEVGLRDVNLFTPPAVVDRKDIRSVCLCLRALALKLRAKNVFKVRDFDDMALSASATESLAKFTRSASIATPTETASSTSNRYRTDAGDLKSSQSVRNQTGPAFGHSASFSAATNGHPAVGSKIYAVQMDLLERARGGGRIEEVAEEGEEQEEEVDDSTPTLIPPNMSQRFSSKSNSAASSSSSGSTFTGTGPRSSSSESHKRERERRKGKGGAERSGGRYREDDEEGEENEVSSSGIAKRGKRGRSGKVSLKKRAGEGGGLIGPFLFFLGTGLAVAFGVSSLIGRMSEKKKEDVVMHKCTSCKACAYEIQPGDTLTDISRKIGKKNWKEIAEKNPDIKDPDLIYPSNVVVV